MTRFLYGKIEVEQVSDNSQVVFGNNLLDNYVSVRKLNEGFGAVSGRANCVVDTITWVTDDDEVDTWGNMEWQRKGETATAHSTC